MKSIIFACVLLFSSIAYGGDDYRWDRNCPDELNLFKGDKWTGYSINVRSDKSSVFPYEITDPDGRVSGCSSVRSCEDGGVADAKDRALITDRITRSNTRGEITKHGMIIVAGYGFNKCDTSIEYRDDGEVFLCGYSLKDLIRDYGGKFIDLRFD